jgi:hypothetical protein
MSYQIEITGTLFEPDRTIRPEQVGADSGTDLAGPDAVEALDPTVLVRATGLAELTAVATEARERLIAALASLRTRA